MNLLYLAHRIPFPPNKGDKIRSFHHIRHLSQRHSIHLACMIDDAADKQHVRALRQYCTSVDAVHRSRRTASLLGARALLTKKPPSVLSFYSRDLAARINRRIATEKLDAVIVFSSVMAEYVNGVPDIPKIIDFVDLDSAKWRVYADRRPFPLSWVYRLEAERLAQYEAEMARTFDHSIFVSDIERALLRAQVKDRPIAVIPNGVDLDYFQPAGINNGSVKPPVVVFSGAMDYFPNVDGVRFFVSKILPEIRHAIPEVRFHIVGRNPVRSVKGLARQPGVVVTGSVPDIRPYLAEATIAVAPLRLARGVQNKVLEAMAMGLPVVGTTAALQGTQATTRDGVRITDEPQQFARDVITLMQNATLRGECSQAARRYVEHNHRWKDLATQLETLIRDTVAPRRRLSNSSAKVER